MKRRFTTLLAVISLGLAAPTPLLAQLNDDDVSERAEELEDARDLLGEAAAVVEQMNDDTDARLLLNRAQAVFIVPDYARASLIAGAAGGQGVLISRTPDGWSGPAFYNIGAINFGAAAGVEAGSIAFMLMTEDALTGFRDAHNVSLNADAGLTIVNWSERAQASVGKGTDVVVWSDTEGLYGDIAISLTDIFWDGEANAAYYGAVHEPVAIIIGTIKDPMQDSELRSEFSALEEAEPESQTGDTQMDKDQTGTNQKQSDQSGQAQNQPATDNAQ
jgi:lipid-binding SYLF domain-containing protein